MRYTTVLPEWTNEPCFIVACGPSLRGMDLRNLTAYGRVIVINDSFQLIPDADLLYFCDSKWWFSRKAQVNAVFTGRHAATMENDIDHMWILRNTGQLGIEEDPSGLRHGSNSGYQAINLAYHLGCKEIYLLGYDMRVDGQRMHWNDRPERQQPAIFAQQLQRIMLPCFNSLAPELKRLGVRVVNCTPDSMLRVFPYEKLSSVLRRIENDNNQSGYQESGSLRPQFIR